MQTSLFTRHGVERVVRYAFELARERPTQELVSATKSNALQLQRWCSGTRSSRRWPASTRTCEVPPYHVDALAAHFVPAPETLDVVVASNLFGDILTDLGGGDCRAAWACRRAATSTRSGSTRRCSSRSTARPPTSPARGSPTPMAADLGAAR